MMCFCIDIQQAFNKLKQHIMKNSNIKIKLCDTFSGARTCIMLFMCILTI